MNLDFRSDRLPQRAHRVDKSAPATCVCADCRYAQPFAIQPRALCQHPTAPLRGRVLFAGQPACDGFLALRGLDVRLGCRASAGSACQVAAHAA
jgi:hypothetical protein